MTVLNEIQKLDAALAQARSELAAEREWQATLKSYRAQAEADLDAALAALKQTRPWIKTLLGVADDEGGEIKAILTLINSILGEDNG